MPRQDKWEQYAEPATDKWEQYADKSPAPTVAPSASPKHQSPFEMIGEGEELGAAGNAAMAGQYLRSGPKEVVGGAKDIFSGKVPEGIHRAYKGAMVTAAPAAISAGPLALMEAPAATLTGLATGQAAKLALKYGSRAAGASGPWSDVLGDVGEVAGSTYGAKAGGAVSKFVKQYGVEAPEGVKLPFGFRIGKKPALEPPPSPEEVTYNRTKELTEAQEAAQAEKVKRESSATRESQRAAKAKEAAFNKNAEENMAIQKRYDDAQAARAQAEKIAKNARFKAEQEHAKELAAAEKARQDEITTQAKLKDVQDKIAEADRAKESARLKLLQQQEKQAIKDANDAAAQKERLRDQHAQALQRRGREQAALDKATKDAATEEDSAQVEVKKLPPERQGSAGARPTASEQFLTNLTKKSILTPADDAQGRQYFGKEWDLKRGEGHQTRVTRLLGWVRGGRSGQGMRDASIGPIPPPPEP